MPNIDNSDLAVNQPIVASDSLLTIEVDASNPLAVGSYEFQLVVTDDSGNNSNPASVRIIVADDQAPTAVIDAPDRVGFGQNFSLSAKNSVDIGGEITRYEWTLIETP